MKTSFAAFVASFGIIVCSSSAEARPDPPDATPAGLDADATNSLDHAACIQRLDAWGVPYEVPEGRVPATIETPVRLTGPVRGVTFVIPWAVPGGQDVLDCRLAVVLAQWAVLLSERRVVEVRIFSFYRFGGRQGVGPQARGRPSQHQFGMAIDAGWFVLEDGTVLDVERDFSIEREGATCDASPSNDRSAILLGIFCDAWRARLFNVQLSPAHNAAHRNHFHFDVGGGNGGWYAD